MNNCATAIDGIVKIANAILEHGGPSLQNIEAAVRQLFQIDSTEQLSPEVQTVLVTIAGSMVTVDPLELNDEIVTKLRLVLLTAWATEQLLISRRPSK